METLNDGRYQLLEIIGEGGMGRVWKAYDTKLKRYVAAKQVTAPAGISAKARQSLYARAEHEARNAAMIEHPLLVTIYDVLVENDHPWMIMELLSVATLADYIDARGPLSQAQAVQLLTGLMDVLGAVHDAGVVHRDIKPSNIAWNEEGSIRLLDFGIAKHKQDTNLTESGMLVGTPLYLAPECILKDTAGPASDMWSVGAVLFYALTGKPAFERSTSQALMYSIAYGTVPQLPGNGPMRDIVSGLLVKKPRQRLTIPQVRALVEKTIGNSQAKTATRPRKNNSTAPSPTKRRAVIAASSIVVAGSLIIGLMQSGVIGGNREDRANPSGSASVTPNGSTTMSPTSAPNSPASSTTTAPASPSPSTSRPYWITDGSIGKVYHDADFTIPLSQGWKVEPGDDQYEVKILTDDNKTYTVRLAGTGSLRSLAESLHSKQYAFNGLQSPITYIGSNYAVWDYSAPTVCNPCPSGAVVRYSTSVEKKPVGRTVQITIHGSVNVPDAAYDKDQREDLDIFGDRVDFTPDSPFAKE